MNFIYKSDVICGMPRDVVNMKLRQYCNWNYCFRMEPIKVNSITYEYIEAARTITDSVVYVGTDIQPREDDIYGNYMLDGYFLSLTRLPEFLIVHWDKKFTRK